MKGAELVPGRKCAACDGRSRHFVTQSRTLARHLRRSKDLDIISQTHAVSFSVAHFPLGRERRYHR
jgi:hypothetical protein